MCRSSLLCNKSIHRAFRPSSARGPLSVAGTVCFDSRMGFGPRILTELYQKEELPVPAAATARPSIVCLRDSHAYFTVLQQDFPGATR